MSTPPLRRRLRPAALVASLVVAGCQVPRFQGPQIQNPPDAFTMKNDVSQERRMFPDRDLVFHAAWIEASWGHFSGIYINGHLGTTTILDVEAARQAAIEAARGERAEFGEIEEIQVDGRPAWGWGEEWRLPNNGLRYAVFRAAVPYDTVTYAVEFRTGDPILKTHPDSLRTIVASFAIGKTRWNYPVIAIVAGLVLLLGAGLRARGRARSERSRSFTLVEVPRKKGEVGDAPPPAAPRVPADAGAGHERPGSRPNG